MKKALYSILFVAISLAVLVSGCVISPRRNSVNHGATGKLYVATAGGILRFGGALQATGNASPEATISGNQTQLSAPQRLFIDANNDRLLVANSGTGAILIFSPASTASGNVAPKTVLTSSGNLAAPVDVAIDTTTGVDLLYVADGQNVLVFSGQSGLTGSVNPVPARTINFTFTIGAILLDKGNNRLFIGDPADNAVDILPNASAATGSAAALISGTISGSNTLLQHPNGLALDNAGRLVVSNSAGPTITIYPTSAVPTGGNVVPVASLVGGNTSLAGPGQLAFHTGAGSSGELYVADNLAASVLTYLNPGNFTLNDNLAPTRNFHGSNTNLSTINGMALDATH